jgi:predicted nucleotidyltransferase
MQEKEMTRTDTATLVEYMRRCANEDRDLDNKQNKKFLQIADRLTEQEATIRHLRVELCNASALAMGHAEAIKTFRKELDLLNSRPKR